MRKSVLLALSALLLASCGGNSSTPSSSAAPSSSEASASSSAAPSSSAASSSEPSSQPSSSESFTDTKQQKMDAIIALLTAPEAGLGNVEIAHKEIRIGLDAEGKEAANRFGSRRVVQIADSKAKVENSLISGMKASAMISVLVSRNIPGVTAESTPEEAVAAFNAYCLSDDARPEMKGAHAELDGEYFYAYQVPTTLYRELTETDYANYAKQDDNKYHRQSYALPFLSYVNEDDIGIIPSISPLFLARFVEELKAAIVIGDDGNATLDMAKVSALADQKIEGNATITMDGTTVTAINAELIVEQSGSKSKIIESYEFSSYGQMSVALPDAEEIVACTHESSWEYKSINDEFHASRCHDCHSVFDVEAHALDDDHCYLCQADLNKEERERFEVVVKENTHLDVFLEVGLHTGLYNRWIEINDETGDDLSLGGGSYENEGYYIYVEEAQISDQGFFFVRLLEQYESAESGEDPCLYNVTQNASYYYFDDKALDADATMEKLRNLVLPEDLNATAQGKLGEKQGQKHIHGETREETTPLTPDMTRHDYYCQTCSELVDAWIQYGH